MNSTLPPSSKVDGNPDIGNVNPLIPVLASVLATRDAVVPLSALITSPTEKPVPTPSGPAVTNDRLIYRSVKS